MSKRKRLSRDPANQRIHKLVAWVKRNTHVVEPHILLPGLLHPERLLWRDKHLPKSAAANTGNGK